MAHGEIAVECAERFAILEENAERSKNHETESGPIRDAVSKHQQMLENLLSLKNLWLGSILTMVLALVSIAVAWGSLLNRVSNLEKYSAFIMEHSYGVQDYERSGNQK